MILNINVLKLFYVSRGYFGDHLNFKNLGVEENSQSVNIECFSEVIDWFGPMDNELLTKVNNFIY